MALVGIDLGTAFSVVATMEDGNVQILQNFEGENTTPSIVFFPDEACLLENAIAGNEAAGSIGSRPEHGVRFVKRMMGRKDRKKSENPDTGEIEERLEKAMVRVGETQYSPEQISSVILKKLIKDAEEILKSEIGEEEGRITDAVITVPAWFGPEERNATEEAARLANLTVRALVPEPIAAAIDYAVHEKTNLVSKTILVFDLGGGTFDATVMRVERDQDDQPLAFWVLGKDGSIELGGSNWDQRLAEHVAEQFAEEHDEDPRGDVAAWHRLLTKCEAAKKSLSQKAKDATVNIDCDYKGIVHPVTVSRAEFDELTQSLTDEAMTKSSELVERIQTAMLLAEQVAKEISPGGEASALKADAPAWNGLVTQCVAAVKTLTQQKKDGDANPHAVLRLKRGGQQHDKTITIDDLKSLGQSANAWSLIDEVLLVGGSTKMKEVQERLENISGIKPKTHKGVDYNVARGAALVAFTPDAWTNRDGLEEEIDVAGEEVALTEATEDGESSASGSTGGGLKVDINRGRGKVTTFNAWSDVVSEGIGIEVYDTQQNMEVNHVIIPAGTSTGEEVKASFGLLKDGQTDIDIVIYKGDSTNVNQVVHLGTVVMEGLPATSRAGEEVEITLMLNSSGLIVGEGRHVKTGLKVPIQVDYSPKLSNV